MKLTQKNDIENREDIKKLVNNFYSKVVPDEMLGPVFEEVAHTDWDHHLPKMYDFWESVLLNAASFNGNPMLRHMEVDRETELTIRHFERWLSLFIETVDEYFQGDIAEKAKFSATNIAGIMEKRIRLNRVI